LARGSILTRARNAIFRSAPELEPSSVSDRDSDTESLGYSPYDGVRNPFYKDGGAYHWYMEQLASERTRKKRYKIFEEMDNDSPELSSALDIYADNATQADPGQEIICIKTDNDKVKKILNDFKKDVGLESTIWATARNVAKNGEAFSEIVLDKALLAKRIKELPGKDIIRNEDEYGRLQKKAFIQQKPGEEKILATFEQWQVVHFRMRKDNTKKYGNGVLESAIKVYRQLAMMEDSMVIARLTRAPQRYAHLVDVEGLDTDAAQNHLDKVRSKMKKRATINPKTGRQDLSYNPLSAEEDIFVGTKAQSKADVKVLQGDNNLSNIKDVFYFQNKLFSATKVPKSYLGLEGDVNSKGTVTEQEIQFARTVRRLQLALIEGYTQMFDFVLALNGVSPSTVEYTISLPLISMIDELRKWQSRLVKLQTAQLFQQVFRVNPEYLMKKFLDMSEEEVKEAKSHEDKLLIQQMTPQNPNLSPSKGTGASNTKHNNQNKMTRSTKTTASTRPGSQQTNMNKNKTAKEKAELLKKFMTEEVTDMEEFLEVLDMLGEETEENFEE
jgi:hypothetical protein